MIERFKQLFEKKTKTCIGCDAQIPADVYVCEHCDAVQERLCVICAEEIAPTAIRCNECEYYQSRWRRFFSFSNTGLAWLTALFAVISSIVAGSAYLLDRESNTNFMVTGSATGVIHVRVWNTGKKPSALRGFQLALDEVPGINERVLPLYPVPSKATNADGATVETAEDQEQLILVVPGEPQRLHLSALHNFTSTCTDDDLECLTRIRKELKERFFRLSITIEESGNWWQIKPSPYSHSEPADTVPGTLIADFFEGACCGVLPK